MSCSPMARLRGSMAGHDDRLSEQGSVPAWSMQRQWSWVGSFFHGAGLGPIRAGS